MEDQSVLSISHLAVGYRTRAGELVAVRDVSLEIMPGESLGLVGESGCGKSTVALAVVNFLGENGFIRAGSIRFRGKELVGRSEQALREIRGNGIGMVYQEAMSCLNPSMRVGDQLVETVLAHRPLTRREAWARCLGLLHSVNIADADMVMKRYPHQLSGGQQQRILIAMALVNEPALLIMDEPTTALDVTVEAAVLDLVVSLRRRTSMSLLFISHNLGVVARVADRIAVMYAGEIAETASAEVIYHRPLHPYTIGLMRCLPDVDAPRGERQLKPIPGQVPALDRPLKGCAFASRCKLATLGCWATPPPYFEIEPGHCVRCHRADEVRDANSLEKVTPASGDRQLSPFLMPSSHALQASDVRVYYPAPARGRGLLPLFRKGRWVRAVDGVTIGVVPGQTIGLVGESGCGKSSLARAIVGLEELHSGRIEFAGFDISCPIRQRPMEAIRAIQMVFQNPDGVLNPSYTVGAQIAVSLRRLAAVSGKDVRRTVADLLRAVHLDESYADRYPRQLSGGEKQRVGIARALAGEPDILICDEPVSSLDVSVQASIIGLLSEIQARRQMGILLISHDLSTVRYLSDYVVVVYSGCTVEEGPTERVFLPPFHPYTAALLAAVPRPDPLANEPSFRLSGPVPSPIDPLPGCRFASRCPLSLGHICEMEPPPARDLGEGHTIVCHLRANEYPRSFRRADLAFRGDGGLSPSAGVA